MGVWSGLILKKIFIAFNYLIYESIWFVKNIGLITVYFSFIMYLRRPMNSVENYFELNKIRTRIVRVEGVYTDHQTFTA